MRRNSKIFIVGHNDSIENSLKKYFQAQGFRHVISNTQDGINVLNQSQVENFFKKFKPEYVFLGSLRSGGIAANQKFPAEFIYENSNPKICDRSRPSLECQKIAVFFQFLRLSVKKPNSRSKKLPC